MTAEIGSILSTGSCDETCRSRWPRSQPRDLSWEEIKDLADCTVYERTPKEKVMERIGDAELVLTNKTVLDRAVLEQLPNLRYIGVLATGVNVIDLEAARERGIAVTNVPGYSTPSVAQMVFALLLELTLQVGHHGALVRSGAWARSADFLLLRPAAGGTGRSDPGHRRFRAPSAAA